MTNILLLFAAYFINACHIWPMCIDSILILKLSTHPFLSEQIQDQSVPRLLFNDTHCTSDTSSCLQSTSYNLLLETLVFRTLCIIFFLIHKLSITLCIDDSTILKLSINLCIEVSTIHRLPFPLRPNNSPVVYCQTLLLTLLQLLLQLFCCNPLLHKSNSCY